MDTLRNHILQFTSKLHQLEQSKHVEKGKRAELKRKSHEESERHRNENNILKVQEATLKERVCL